MSRRKHNGLDMAAVNGGSVLKFSKISEKAFAPMKGSALAAGYDLRR